MRSQAGLGYLLAAHAADPGALAAVGKAFSANALGHDECEIDSSGGVKHELLARPVCGGRMARKRVFREGGVSASS